MPASTWKNKNNNAVVSNQYSFLYLFGIAIVDLPNGNHDLYQKATFN